MGQDLEALYQARLRRYVTALNNGKPDRVPIRPFAAEFTGRHAGYSCQQLTQHYPDAFEAMIQCCKDYDWDAVPASMVYVWTGITDAATVKYYGVPGVDVPLLEYDTTENLFLSDLLTEPLTFRDGGIVVPEGPGLGVDIDMGFVKKYRVDR